MNIESIEKVSKIFSLVAIPLVIGFFGWEVQKNIADRNLQKEYIQMAITILSASEKQKVDDNLKKWAIDLVDYYSPIKIPEALSKELESGNLSFFEKQNSKLFKENLNKSPLFVKTFTINDNARLEIQIYESGDVLVGTNKRYHWFSKNEFNK
ncbi:MAG: hypothetical protein COB04_13190 [Gammaproteobacteria bacterium]|nr:MAG: hypothetical protein COB04_13190 [Gammaproteobacteria bacterium]